MIRDLIIIKQLIMKRFTKSPKAYDGFKMIKAV